MGSQYGKYFDALVLHETRLWAMVERRVRMTEGAVSLGRFEILKAVHQSGEESRVQDIAETLLVTVGAASRIVDRLVMDGLLSRSPHPSDRRSYRIGLTTSGRTAFEVTAGAREKALEELLGRFDPGLIDTLTQALADADARLANGPGA